MKDTHRYRLFEAVSRNSAIVLSLPSAGALRHYRSRLLAISPRELWVESVPGEGPLIDELLRSGQRLGVAFKNNDVKIVFAVRLLGREPSYRLNPSAATTVDALRLEGPEELKVVQRRANYRATVQPDDLVAKVWRIGATAELAARPPDAQKLHAEVRDISLGGMGVILSGDGGGPPKVTTSERVRVEIRREGRDIMLLEGRVYCGTNTAAGSLRCGIQWAQSPTVEHRQGLAELAKLVAELERQELRRARCGIEAA